MVKFSFLKTQKSNQRFIPLPNTLGSIRTIQASEKSPSELNEIVKIETRSRYPRILTLVQLLKFQIIFHDPNSGHHDAYYNPD